MKTKKQIDHFLRKRKYKSEIDFEGISLYCKNKYGIKLHVPSSYSTTDHALDYAAFANWLESGYGAGDVVKWGEYIGLVQDSNIEDVKICLRIDRNGPNFNSITIPIQDITHADENALKRINHVLDEMGKEFGNPFFVITDKFIPGSGSLVCFQNHQTGQDGYGVVRQIQKSGEIIMYCYCYKGETVKFNMHEYLGNINDFSFTSFKPTDYPRKALETELNKAGKSWNHYLKRIEPVNMRVDLNERYWYITDKMQVTSDIEKNKATSNKRYLAGNYFRREEDAVAILAAEMEIRRDFLARAEQ